MAKSIYDFIPTVNIVYPSNPTIGQTFVTPDGVTLAWNGMIWQVIKEIGGTPVSNVPTTIADAFPGTIGVGSYNITGQPPYTLPVATTVTLGGVKIDDVTIHIDATGVISADIPKNVSAFINDAGYLTDATVHIPVASDTILGGVKIGDNIVEQPDGTISVPIASDSTPGVVKVGDNITQTLDGTISIPKATNSTLGVVKAGTNVNIDGAGAINVSIPTATNSSLGVVKAGTNVNIDGQGAVNVSKGAGINTVSDIPDVNTTSGGATLNDGALLVYNQSSLRWDTVNNLRADTMDGGFF